MPSIFPRASNTAGTAVSRLLVRADVSESTGTGHVMRCLALGQAWQEAGGQVLFAMSVNSPNVARRLVDEQIEVSYLSKPANGLEDADNTVALARQTRASWVVVDGYGFDHDYQKVLKDAGLRLLILDDYGHAAHYYADLVLNQNLDATESRYQSREPHSRLLLGTSYALLRREFWIRGEREMRIALAGRKVLVTLGGSDPNNITLKVIRALRLLEALKLHVKVVLGPANSHHGTIRRELKYLDRMPELLVAPADMPDLMAWADIAVTAAGSTCWELAFMGVPLISVVASENQRGIAGGLAKIGVGINLGWHETVTEKAIARSVEQLVSDCEVRSKMSRFGRTLVDGLGASRVIAEMTAARARLKEPLKCALLC